MRRVADSCIDDLLQPQRHLCSRGKKRGPFKLTRVYIENRINGLILYGPVSFLRDQTAVAEVDQSSL
jgi:hypothetical protein